MKSSATRYQILATILSVIVGCIVGVIAIAIWGGMIVDEAVEARKALIASMALTIPESAAEGGRSSRAAVTRLVSESLMPIRELALLGTGGSVLAQHPDDGLLGRSERLRSLTQTDGLVYWTAAEGFSFVAAIPVRSGNARWGTLAVDFDMASAEDRIDRAIFHVLGLVGTFAVLNFLIVGWLVRRWMLPITELTRTMDQVQNGDLTVEVAEDRTDEIGDLSRHFNAMLQAIRGGRGQSIQLAMRQANIEKFAALGRLSAGVAHQINNPVGGLLTALDVIRDAQPGSERYREYLELMKEGLERISDIVSQLLRFSRQTTGERTIVDLNVVLDEVLRLSRLHYRGSRLHLIRRFGDIPLIRGGHDLIHQLFLNIVLNSVQEMPDGGILKITTGVDGDRIFVRFDDTGPGIPEEHQDRIFEPFYTTKEVGEGTGLGLSVALGIVEAHGGTIHAENRPEGGARFIIRFPMEIVAVPIRSGTIQSGTIQSGPVRSGGREERE